MRSIPGEKTPDTASLPASCIRGSASRSEAAAGQVPYRGHLPARQVTVSSVAPRAAHTSCHLSRVSGLGLPGKIRLIGAAGTSALRVMLSARIEVIRCTGRAVLLPGVFGPTGRNGVYCPDGPSGVKGAPCGRVAKAMDASTHPWPRRALAAPAGPTARAGPKVKQARKRERRTSTGWSYPGIRRSFRNDAGNYPFAGLTAPRASGLLASS